MTSCVYSLKLSLLLNHLRMVENRAAPCRGNRLCATICASLQQYDRGFLEKRQLMVKVLRPILLVTALLLVSGFTECYKPVTKTQLPPHIKTVAVPAFQNNALRFKIEHRFTE